eukprot:Blabericola_migrator_1__13044@NODE_878_length_6197_cov_81_643556_g621_i0_p4_GENE_NODE_878_length_6197_cov_81_643556_g621_i0NODE_878_length_6197_cov_81_643556_g621_i0_p4_ORF_typecomplete_len237_score38_95Kelch_6/PF13964_6/0_00037Kelch_1/PF01344_25/0_0035Kelch_5/PF13854_6/1_2e04Kelch_5/PF13854_6/0_0067Kelch_4/PF13418_6/0_0072Kelch_3/PF13415_6/2_2e03Kelch_3/PF13415_6/0_1Kelch_2/PF07646_15/0_24_NODE_878_length_6197_cov_81_643556_g621_i028783588
MNSLRNFLLRNLPADAIRLYSHQSVASPREFRRFKGFTQHDDMLEWARVTLETTPVRRCDGNGPPTHSLTEVFVARWLSYDRNLPLASHLHDRQRRVSGTHLGKRKKNLELGELLRLASEHVRSPTQTPTLVSPVDSIEANRMTSALRDGLIMRGTPNDRVARSGEATPTRLEKLAPVGGTTKILCHASAYVEPYTYVFGGLTQHGCSDSLWSLDPRKTPRPHLTHPTQRKAAGAK